MHVKQNLKWNVEILRTHGYIHAFLYYQVFCALCSNLKFRLYHLDGKEGRVCISCHSTLIKSEHRYFLLLFLSRFRVVFMAKCTSFFLFFFLTFSPQGHLQGGKGGCGLQMKSSVSSQSLLPLHQLEGLHCHRWWHIHWVGRLRVLWVHHRSGEPCGHVGPMLA